MPLLRSLLFGLALGTSILAFAKKAVAAGSVFPEVGATYRFEYAPGSSAGSESSSNQKALRLHVLESLPSGWIHAKRIYERWVVDPSDSSKSAINLEEGPIAWYNMQAFSKAVKVSSDKASSEVWPEELDAIIAAPTHHKVLFENEFVRVLDTKIAPGEKTPVHTHRWPSVLQVQSFSPYIRRDAAGNVVLDASKAPAPASLPLTVWSPSLPAHSLENVGDQPIHVVSVEIKKESD